MTQTTLPGPIAQKLLHALARARDRKIVELKALATARQHEAELQTTAATRDSLGELHPIHAIYVYVQNQVSIMSETITQLPTLDKLATIAAMAEDRYMPSGPPLSPLTGSYFFCWAVFDAAVGDSRETIGTCILAVARWAGSRPDFIRLIEAMQQSRMGLYIHDGCQKDTIDLRELITGERLPCIVPSGYRGERGEVWLVRVLPPPGPSFTASLVMTTPYVVVHPGEVQWQRYLDRTLPKVGAADLRNAYERLMKYGLNLNYWNEYIFEAYADHETSAVFLRGLPDIDASRPHSRKSGEIRDSLLAGGGCGRKGRA